MRLLQILFEFLQLLTGELVLCIERVFLDLGLERMFLQGRLGLSITNPNRIQSRSHKTFDQVVDRNVGICAYQNRMYHSEVFLRKCIRGKGQQTIIKFTLRSFMASMIVFVFPVPGGCGKVNPSSSNP